MNIKINIIKNKGFTLIELMITVAIVAIISSIALPSYTEYVRKSKRADAKVELLRIAQLQESYFVQNLSYAKNFKKASGGLQLGDTVKSEQEVYLIEMAVTPSGCNGLSGANACETYTITAKAQGAQADDKCKNFILKHTGQKDVSATGLSKTCWK